MSRQGVPTSAFRLEIALVAGSKDGNGRVWGRIRACCGRGRLIGWRRLDWMVEASGYFDNLSVRVLRKRYVLIDNRKAAAE